MLKWFNRFRIVHFIVLILCTGSLFWLPLMGRHLIETLASSFPKMNDSSVMYTQYQQAYARKYLQLIY